QEISFEGFLRCWRSGEEPDRPGNIGGAMAVDQKRGELGDLHRRGPVAKQSERATVDLGQVPTVAPGVRGNAANETSARDDAGAGGPLRQGGDLADLETVARGRGIGRKGPVNRRKPACDLRARGAAGGADVVEVPPEVGVLVEDPPRRRSSRKSKD